MARRDFCDTMRPMNLFDDPNLVFAVVYLNGPREKYWGILYRNTSVGIWLTGTGLSTVQDWLDQQGRPADDPLPLLTTTFFPMHRVEKIALDEGAQRRLHPRRPGGRAGRYRSLLPDRSNCRAKSSETRHGQPMIRQFLKNNWKSLAIWSGVGGLAVGGAVYAIRRLRRQSQSGGAHPDDAEELTLETHPFEIQVGEAVSQARCVYHLRGHPIQDLERAGGAVTRSSGVFRDSDPVRHGPGRSGAHQHDSSFYAAVGIPRYFKRRDLLDHLCKDSQLVFYLCLVGGGHGVPTAKILSRGRLKAWESAAAPAAIRPGSD